MDKCITLASAAEPTHGQPISPSMLTTYRSPRCFAYGGTANLLPTAGNCLYAACNAFLKGGNSGFVVGEQRRGAFGCDNPWDARS